MMKNLPKFTFGMGDRFGAEGEAQLQAVLSARAQGIEVCPVWNKSHREHTIVGTEPPSLRAEADAAVKQLDWTGDYFVDADHINLETVGGFAETADFFTLDVADAVGEPSAPEKVEAFLKSNEKYVGTLPIEGAERPITLSREELEGAAAKFLSAIEKAGAIFRRIESLKGDAPFATEVSIDETDYAQTPGELFCILSMIAAEGIPAQTVAPKFNGRFNKGVDYVGDLGQFEKEFDEDLHIIKFAVAEFGLPKNLKLSVHSGSDKFSLYPIINRLIKKHGAGLHVKTAGTTWLEEVIGLAEADGDGLGLAKEIYTQALEIADDLIAPYRTVVDIDQGRLPSAEQVGAWSSDDFTSALRHDQSNPAYNLHFRQLLHVGFKMAAKKGSVYRDALRTNRAVIAKNVTSNLFDRHIFPIFKGD
jgi:hypothetical protein